VAAKGNFRCYIVLKNIPFGNTLIGENMRFYGCRYVERK
jgi:hypothetical protein